MTDTIVEPVTLSVSSDAKDCDWNGGECPLPARWYATFRANCGCCDDYKLPICDPHALMLGNALSSLQPGRCDSCKNMSLSIIDIKRIP